MSAGKQTLRSLRLTTIQLRDCAHRHSERGEAFAHNGLWKPEVLQRECLAPTGARGAARRRFYLKGIALRLSRNDVLLRSIQYRNGPSC